MNSAISVDRNDTELRSPETDGVELSVAIEGVVGVPLTDPVNSRFDNEENLPHAEHVLVQDPRRKIFPLAEFRLFG